MLRSGQWRVTWPDGSSQSATSATALLDQIRAQQFDPVVDVAAMRRALSDRAFILIDALVDDSLGDDEFVMALDRVGFWSVDVGHVVLTEVQ